jgi:DNA-binding transcriptional regulator YdaS (Cro superfamily)
MKNRDMVKLAVAEAGGFSALGRAIGVKYQSIQRWKKIPAERVLAVERATGIPKERLRPDLYRSQQSGAISGT